MGVAVKLRVRRFSRLFCPILHYFARGHIVSWYEPWQNRSKFKVSSRPQYTPNKFFELLCILKIMLPSLHYVKRSISFRR